MNEQTVINPAPKPWYQKGGCLTALGIVGVLIVFVMLGIGSFVSKNNQLVMQKQSVEQQTGQIQTVLQRRADLIPNLVNVVKGQQKQEKSVYTAIANARRNYYGAQDKYNNANNENDRVKAMSQQERSLNILVGSIQEAYPKLDSSSQMQSLMVELEGTENRVSVERHKYNQLVGTYNTTVAKFPGSIVANIMGYRSMTYFNASTNAQNAPTVKF